MSLWCILCSACEPSESGQEHSGSSDGDEETAVGSSTTASPEDKTSTKMIEEDSSEESSEESEGSGTDTDTEADTGEEESTADLEGTCAVFKDKDSCNEAKLPIPPIGEGGGCTWMVTRKPMRMETTCTFGPIEFEGCRYAEAAEEGSFPFTCEGGTTVLWRKDPEGVRLFRVYWRDLPPSMTGFECSLGGDYPPGVLPSGFEEEVLVDSPPECSCACMPEMLIE